MITILEVHQFQTDLEEYLLRAIAGEEFVIAENGKPLARLLPFVGNHMARYPGSANDTILFSEKYTNPLSDDIIADFEQ